MREPDNRERRFVKGTIEDIPLADDLADVIISNCVFNLSGDKPRLFREAARVVRPGGRFAVIDVVADEGLDETTRADMQQAIGSTTSILTAGRLPGVRGWIPMASRPAIVSPDSFKGTFTASEVAAAIGKGLRDGGMEAVELPVGDGGDGTLDALVEALGGEYRTATVSDPLGRSIEAHFGLLPDGRAVVEMAQASGLGLVDEGERDAWAASTRGTGELIAAAVEAGAAIVVVTVGGSATTDGGAGALQALEEAGVEPQLEVVCDVRTPWEDAPRTFGPQKGADHALVRRLEERLDALAARAPRDPRGEPMTGCAGGLSGGLWAFRGATLVPGAAYVLDALDFDNRAREASFVVTGEGQLDEQTLAGKAVGELAERCRRAGVDCHAVVGRNNLDDSAGIDLASVREATTLDELREAGTELARL